MATILKAASQANLYSRNLARLYLGERRHGDKNNGDALEIGATCAKYYVFENFLSFSRNVRSQIKSKFLHMQPLNPESSSRMETYESSRPCSSPLKN